MDKLNSSVKSERLAELKRLFEQQPPVRGSGSVNNHIHTFYSFSPYSPTKAIWAAYNAGLTTAGIMDHDSVSGAREFIEAGEIIGMATTNGVECRVSFGSTLIEGKRINNPDQNGVAYMALHAIPHKNIERVSEFFAPYREKRNVRNRAMTAKINEIVSPYGLCLDYDGDVLPLSKAEEGGSVTERHLLYALSLAITAKFGRGSGVIELLGRIGITPGEKLLGYLSDAENPHYEYDLLGVLKGNMVEQFYIDADEECPHVTEAIALAREVGAISAYAYLGDVGDSVTGDKKTQKFEDDYLDVLFGVIKKLGFDAVTYMPSRNSHAQLDRIRALCGEYELMQISGEDINSPRQSFVCPQMTNPEFQNLVDATWELIRHERK